MALKSKLITWSGFIGIFIGWQLSVSLLDIEPYKLPGPLVVCNGLYELTISGRLYESVVASLYRVTWGFYLAVFTAVPIGLLIGSRKSAIKICNPLIQFFRPISPLAWIPLALIWFGIGDAPAIFLIFMASFFPMLVFSISAVSNINITWLRVADNFELSGFRTLFQVILPAVLPDIVTGIRITLGTAWLVIVAAEMIAVKSGIGYLIVDARNSMRMDYVVAGMLITGTTGLVLDLIVRQLEHLPSVRWSRYKR